MTNSRLIPVALALFACLLWAGNFVMARGAHEVLQPIGLSFFRWLVAIVFLLPFAWKPLWDQRAIAMQHPWRILGYSIFGVAIFNSLIYVAATGTTAHQIALIAATAPVWTLILATVLKQEPFAWCKLWGIMLGLAGAIIVLTAGRPAALFSLALNPYDGLVLLASVCWSIYSVLLKYRPKGLSGLPFLLLISIIGLLFITPVFVWESVVYGMAPFTGSTVMIYLYVGIAASIVAWLAWNKALAHIGAVEVSVVYYTIPMFSSILAVVFLKEPLQPYHGAAFLLVVGGIIVANKNSLAHWWRSA